MNLSTILEKLHGATLIAVSKTKSNEQILELYHQGQRAFGENKVQELVEKFNTLPKDIEWHMIGHLQTNKVKLLVPFVHLIHSVDSLKLLLDIQKEAKKINRTINVLLQIYIATEETKYGLDTLEATRMMEHYLAQTDMLSHVCIRGVMGMASNTADTEKIKKEFTELKSMFEFLKKSYLPFDDNFNIISMGMSSDFELAIACGSNMVRIGSLLFGTR